MAQITLDGIRHSYLAAPSGEQDWALKNMDMVWEDGGAYALLGSSGCGKTTLLNIISGLLMPTAGRVLFGEKEVTALPPDQRNIAQVFQFPVVYDTMTVYDNLAFPLRNRGLDEKTVDARVQEIAAMIDLTSSLHNRAAGLTADGKQKISLGRGLVRSDVNAILFDEPLTVIDPHLKWQLRSKLKELHHRVGATMIYVTHDQTEAMTFADQVVVMHGGRVVQAGTPVELFETPAHTFVGHFIGSPGMNILPAHICDGQVVTQGTVVLTTAGQRVAAQSGARLEVGVRPEHVYFAREGIEVEVLKVADSGRFRIVDTRHEQQLIRVLLSEAEPVPQGSARVAFRAEKTHLYVDQWRLTKGGDLR
ncbi:ABC transporter ATP-binding protein [Granulosicoccaceae sp. 1_MG-2023]|nr:ABC transporter ATP-binding protein [Granulosicoccaceae sp. 1_MG-2023]